MILSNKAGQCLVMHEIHGSRAAETSRRLCTLALREITNYGSHNTNLIEMNTNDLQSVMKDFIRTKQTHYILKIGTRMKFVTFVAYCN